MTIQQLKCFIAMAELLHYIKAANRLYISQPSLSYSISELEKELGLPLFERRDNKTFLTRYGEELLPYAEQALAKLEEITIKAYQLLDPAVGAIALGNIYSISFAFIPQVLERFYADKNNAQITVSCFQGVSRVLVDKLMANELDMIITGADDSPELESAYLFTQELKLVVPVSHRLAEREQVRLEDVAGEGLISLGENSNISSHIAACFQQRGLAANFMLSVAECSAMGAFISSGLGIAIAPIVPSLASTNVRIIPFAEDDCRLLGRPVYLHWVKNRYLPPVATRLLDFIINQFAAQWH